LHRFIFATCYHHVLKQYLYFHTFQQRKAIVEQSGRVLTQNIFLNNNTISASGKQPRQDTGAGVSVAEASGIKVNGLTVQDSRTQTHEALEIVGTVQCGKYPTGISTSGVSFNGSTRKAILDERKCGN
jgi:hypothetical protein